MKKLKKIVTNEDGQALILVAILMSVLLGFAALVVDVGTVYLTKTKLQDAADAAALAGAQDLPNITIAQSTAIKYAGLNGVQVSKTTTTTPYNSDSTKIEVVCKKTVSYTFARVLGFTQTEVSARAVGLKSSQWAGEALPFINLDNDYTTKTEIEVWEKTSLGNFESIDGYEIINPSDPAKLYFKVDYLNGVELKKGTVATIKQEVGYVYDQHKPDKPVYLLSLSSTVIISGKVKLKDGSYQSLSNLKNNDVVDPSQLVLLKCIFHDYHDKDKTLFLKVLKEYDILNNEFPPDYISPEGGSSRLVE